MTRKVIVPPYIGSPDNARCAQAVILMILNHFMPEKEWTFADVDRICGYIEGKHTWASVYILSMIERGFDLVSFSSFDKERFIQSPEDYLFERMGEAKAKNTLANIDLDFVLETERRLLTEQNYRRVPRDWQWQDVSDLLDEGYLIYAWVNSRKLDNRDGDTVSGHAILIFDYDAENKVVTFHDPGGHVELTGGTMAHVNKWCAGRVGIDHFMAAAKNPGAEGGSSLVGFRLKK